MASGNRINYFRTCLIWTGGLLWTLVIAILALMVFAVSRSGNSVHWFSRIWSRFLLWLAGVKIRMKGLENVPADHSVLIVSNHQSLCDIFVMAGYLPLRFSWIAKREVFKVPFVGAAMKAANYVPIDRENREQAFQSLENASRILKRHSVVIFPEGTRTRSGELGKFKHGAEHLLAQSGVPVLPVTITNSFERIPPETVGIVPGTINVQVDPEIRTDGLNRRQIAGLMRDIWERMERRIGDSRRRD
ncbi:1-acyl-sn-glycerol-3-phosphate acyltransferase [bacterium]|nr:1-acyl-sn-glycerol-3-phosphate acyltransferase [candidate division CSSED10-310 bacterium]